MTFKINLAPVTKRPATTVSGVLRQSINFLEEEGRWVQSQWFSDDEQAIDPEAPLCSKGWGACADGAIAAMIFGVPYKVRHGECQIVDTPVLPSKGTKEQRALYHRTRAALDEAAGAASYHDEPTDYESIEQAKAGGDIIVFNDMATSRTEVLNVFRKAYRHAQYVERKARESRKAVTA